MAGNQVQLNYSLFTSVEHNTLAQTPYAMRDMGYGLEAQDAASSRPNNHVMVLGQLMAGFACELKTEGHCSRPTITGGSSHESTQKLVI